MSWDEEGQRLKLLQRTVAALELVADLSRAAVTVDPTAWQEVRDARRHLEAARRAIEVAGKGSER